MMRITPDNKHSLYNVFQILVSTFLVFWLLVSFADPAQANSKFAAIAIDARTGKILFAKNADARRYPASLTKIMTLYLVFEDLRAKRITMDTPFIVSRYAAGRPPSKLGFKPGRSILVRHAIRALVTKSANDVATAIAENLNGTEGKFAKRMTRTARRLGMTRTTFRNASGLPSRYQVTTARDMATLGLRLQRDFPEYYKFFSLKRFTYRGRRYGNHNKLLGRITGVDGIKTGYTRASGFNLTSSARRGKKRIIAVVMGGRSGRSRNRYMSALIKRMFAKKRLTNSTRIALTAGNPPGYVRSRRKIAVATKVPVPLPRIKPVLQPTRVKVAKVKKQQDRIVTPAPAPVPAPVLVENENNNTVSTFKVANIVDDDGKSDELEFGNDIGSASVISSAKADLIVPQPVKVAAMVPVTEKVLVEETKHTDSWNIQIGAFPNKESANGRLASATKRARRNLRGKVAFTLEVKKNGARFYRARFAGFSRKTAKRACRTLSKKGFGCFALAPRS